MTLADQIAELRREEKQRARVYPRWVQDGRMSQAAADRQIGALRAAITTIEACQAGTPPPPDASVKPTQGDLLNG